MDMYQTDMDNPVWDISQAPQYAQINDEDFLALFKQYPPADNPYSQSALLGGAGINPQNLTDFGLLGLTPPSDDSSPSPPNYSEPTASRRTSIARPAAQDAVLKRKATPATTKGGRRKSGTAAAAPAPEDNRLLKRKEQNRAAQRAFRERKEKHVKDLEDKVAALEAKNVEAVSENENLRDLLTRLQDENVNLKKFTFSVPKAGSTAASLPSPASSASAISPSSGSSVSPNPSLSGSNGVDWSSLTSFDPSMLNLLDESSQGTATNGAMSMDFAFGDNHDSSNFASGSTGPYTTIASNPSFMSYADTFNSPFSNDAGTSSALDFNFDMWNPSPIVSPPTAPPTDTLDELFGIQSQSPSEFSSSAASRSPVIHQAGPSSSASPSAGTCGSTKQCPKTRSELSALIDNQGSSPFTATSSTSPNPYSPPPVSLSTPSPFASSLPTATTIRKSQDALGSIVACEGTKFPMTKQSDQNVEVLSAWRTITSNPRFKDTDINELCSAFTSKARCDGTKVVLEPSGVHHILDALSNRK